MSKEITEVIDLTEERFKQVAPPQISYEAEKGFAMQILMNNDYLIRVAKENPPSLAQAITNVAAIGLSLNPAEKQAYLIPRTVRANNQYVSKVFLEPSYMGLCKLVTDSGAIEWIQANCVYSGDTFVDNGPGERPTHNYNAFARDRGDFVGVYSVAKTATGDYLTTIMDAEKINELMERSESVKAYRAGKTKSGGPWLTDFAEMAKKTVVRNQFKMLPRSAMSAAAAEAVHLSNENEGFEPIVNNPNIRSFTAEQKAHFDYLIESDDYIGMYVFLTSVGEGVWSSLYESFEKGTKGKFTTIANNLYSKGEATLREYTDSINDCAVANDPDGLIQLVSELSDDALETIKPRLSTEAMLIIGREE